MVFCLFFVVVVVVVVVVFFLWPKEEVHLKHKLSMFSCYRKNVNTFLKNNICSLKQIVCETKK